MQPCPLETSVVAHHLTAIWKRGGWVGVDLFFVLSGFLVSGLLFREHEKHQKLQIVHFLVRRGFKIYPPFWILIGLTVLLGTLQHQRPSLRSVASELLFLQNYGPALWTHTWSLAVEEHFYLLLALTFFVLAKRAVPEPFNVIPMAFGLVACTCLALRLITSVYSPYHYKTHIFPTHLRLDGLFFGVLLAHGFHRYPVQFLSIARRFRFLLAGVGGATLIPAFCLPLESTPFVYTFGLSLFYIGSGCLLVAALGSRPPATWLGHGLAYIGSHSYSIYLWHLLVSGLGIAIGGYLSYGHYPWFVYAGVYVAGSVALGIGMSVLVEFPVLRVRERLFPSRGAPLNYGAMVPIDPPEEQSGVMPPGRSEAPPGLSAPIGLSLHPERASSDDVA